MSATVEVLGVYPIEFTRDLVREHWRPIYGDTVTDQELERIVDLNEDSFRCNMERLHLIELIVDTDLEAWDAGKLVQDHPQTSNSQVPYDEAYLSPDGMTVESRREPLRRPFRIVFYLHYVELSKPLFGPWGAVELPEACSLPDRLKSITGYDAYW